VKKTKNKVTLIRIWFMVRKVKKTRLINLIYPLAMKVKN